MPLFRTLLAALLLLIPAIAHAEDGYELWLRYRPLAPAEQARYRALTGGIVAPSGSATVDAAVGELQRGLGAMLGRTGGIALVRSSRIADPEGYSIRSRGRRIVIEARSDVGLLYGAFRLLRMVQTLQPLDHVDIADAPKLKLRLLDHWDNLDRHVERGYSGASIWDWQKLPGWRDPRYTDYARANASVGINGAVLNNVNSNADILRPEWLAKVAAVADELRPWGIKVYLSARFSAPIELGKLPTADPLDPRVQAWWKAKADEIYRIIPDFGGFLVKANSEGQPGPQDYKRSHAEGANMLADALAPHHGIVMWRAFVYASDGAQDRAKQAYDEFKPLDGTFRPNVILQVKNGPVDFQPREPFHPLFGAMPKTRLMFEGQITKEYLGFATHIAWLGDLWEEALGADTGRGSSVDATLSGMAGVANIGSDRNWSGSQFDQANWYAFGRLAWDPGQHPAAIAEEWARMTFGNDPAVVRTVPDMLAISRQAVVDYMTPLGLHHLMGTGHHYGPAPWVSDLARPEWNPAYYHRADREGIGFDRTATGSDALAQYAPDAARRLAESEDYLLWFHHVPWLRRMLSGRTLWDELVARYDRGVGTVGALRRQWAGLAGKVDAERYEQVAAFLAIQQEEARWWRDASIAYWQSVNRLPLPAGAQPPEHPLDWYRALSFPYAPGQAK
jgi:alpha-glucuronidase